ncbi:hypothetical protein ACA910_001603 [Epithemia clementina (nom. ined.)]
MESMHDGVVSFPVPSNPVPQCVKLLTLGNRRDASNVFRWDRVVLNLPGNTNYNSTLPWVYRVRQDGGLAADVHPYMGNMRETGPTKEDAWKAASKIAKAAAYFGLQDAARKRRPQSQTLGAWAGAIIESTESGVFKLVLQDQWDKV